jgi:Na+/proline symporter
MITPEILAILGLISSSSVFYFYARTINKEKLTLDGFILSDSSLQKEQFGNTFAASSISLATFIMFFFFGSKIYGLFLLVSPFSYLLGQYLFVRLIKKCNVDFRDCRTIADFYYKFFPSKKVAKLITLMSLMSCIMLVFIELYIGSVVFSIFLPNDALYQTVSFLGMGILILMYVKLGGYKALIKTDMLQLTLMLLATFIIFIYGIIAPTNNDHNATNILLNTLNYTGDSWFVYWFVIWLIALNIVTPFTQLALWQRIAASKCNETSLKGVVYSSWKVIALCSFPILGFILLDAKGYSFESFQSYLQTVKQTSWFCGYVLFPLLIVGLCSTVFSSADTAIISIIYAISDRNTFLDSFSNMSEKKIKKNINNDNLSYII